MPDATALLELDREALAALLADLDQPSYRARQIWRWIYERGVLNPEAMTDLPSALRHDLGERFTLPQDPATVQTSADQSTTKALIALSDSELVETVLIRHEPHEHASQRLRRTVCISSQAGCAMGCVFCATGLQGFRRQLTVGEIIHQVLLAREWARAEGEELTHAVFMGMGEPLANYGAVSEALSRLSDPDSLAFSPRRITVSTVGLPPQIRSLAQDHPQVNLAISLHSPDPQLRHELVPVPGASLEDIIDAAREHSELTRRRVTFEYVLIRGRNDSRAHARRLAARLRGIRAQVNLIPLNPSPGIAGDRPSRRTTLGFQETLVQSGVPTNVRVEKGRDIAAACGQLRGDRLREEPAEADRPR